MKFAYALLATNAMLPRSAGEISQRVDMSDSLPSWLVPSPMHRSKPLYVILAAAADCLAGLRLTSSPLAGLTLCQAAEAQHVAEATHTHGATCSTHIQKQCEAAGCGQMSIQCQEGPDGF